MRQRQPVLLFLAAYFLVTVVVPWQALSACQKQCPRMAGRARVVSACCQSQVRTQTLTGHCCCTITQATTDRRDVIPLAPVVSELEAVVPALPAPRYPAVISPSSFAFVAREVAAPRGPPLPFASLRAPPALS